MSETEKKKLSGYLAFIVFSIALFIMKFAFHELWKDEWQAWLIATDIPTLAELFAFLPYEGHPSLWFLLLRFFNLIAELVIPQLPKDLLLQGIHLILSISCYYFLFLRMRGNLLLKIIIASGYFIFFEYSVVNRSYVLLMLLSFVLASFGKDDLKHRWVLCIALFLLTQSEVYGLFMGLGYLTFFTAGALIRKTYPLKTLAPLYIAYATGVLLFVLTIYPRNELHLTEATLHQFGFFEVDRWLEAFKSLFFDTLLIGLQESREKPGALSFLTSLLLLLALTCFFRPARPVMWAYLAFILSDLMFTAVLYQGGPRQWGMHVIFLVALTGLLPDNHMRSFSPKIRPAVYALLSLILFSQIIHSARITWKEIRYPFSNSREAGAFIASIVEGSDIVAINKVYATPVIGYSQRKFFSLPEEKEFSFFMWKERMYIPTMKELLWFSEKRKRELYVVSYRPLNLRAYYLLAPVADFDKGNIRQENYFIYKLIR